ncbi:MAG: hypothetical protein D6691_04500 [Candidatus Hydrogenedentota bacterium]|nr:MAG: hypothetical protein D6691_04500 [Candidatus Hydrogenedentota bacterium]
MSSPDDEARQRTHIWCCRAVGNEAASVARFFLLRPKWRHKRERNRGVYEKLPKILDKKIKTSAVYGTSVNF